MSGPRRRCLQHPLLFGLLLTVQAASGQALPWVETGFGGKTPVAAAPCTVPAAGTGGSEWLAPIGPTSPLSTAPTPEEAAAADAAAQAPVVSALYLGDSVTPFSPLVDRGGVAAAAAAGTLLTLVGAWRWYRSSRLPWPGDASFGAARADRDDIGHDSADDTRDAIGWRLSRFDDLPPSRLPAEDLRPIEPLYTSLDDDDVIDVEPLAMMLHADDALGVRAP